MTALPQKPWFTIKEAVFYLSQAAGRQVSRTTVYRWIERGELEISGVPFFKKITHASLQRKLYQMYQV